MAGALILEIVLELFDLSLQLLLFGPEVLLQVCHLLKVVLLDSGFLGLALNGGLTGELFVPVLELVVVLLFILEQTFEVAVIGVDLIVFPP